MTNLPQAEELDAMRRWLEELFEMAGRGLPWPYQVGLNVVGKGFTLGMYSGLLATTWLLTELERQAAHQDGTVDWVRLMNAQWRELEATLAQFGLRLPR